jgi:hypothetical protein
MDKPHAGFSTCKSTTLLLITVKAGSTTMSMIFHDDLAKRSVPTATKLRHGQTSNKYYLLEP